MLSTETIGVIFDHLKSGRVIRVADRTLLGISGVTVEEVLDSLVCSHSALLHGTGEIIQAGTLLRLSRGRDRHGIRRDKEGFATDTASIAMLKALFSNAAGVNLKYPMVISPASPLILTIVNWQPEVKRERGYVHLIGPKDRFEREGSTWQWVTSAEDVQFAGAVEIEMSDFSYQVMGQPTA
jgi:hypothetical protein